MKEKSLYLKVLHDVSSHQYSLDAICGKFYCESYTELIDYLTKIFEDSLEEFILDPNFIQIYHDFLYALSDSCDSLEELQYLSFALSKQISIVKKELKPYNKGEKDKKGADTLYHSYTILKNELSGNLNYTDNQVFNLYENDNVKVMKYIIFDLKDLDALYHVIMTHEEIVNIYSTDDQPLIEIVIRYILDNYDNLSDEDRIYYRSVITMIFLREELKIEEDKLNELITEVSYASDKNKGDLYFARILKYLDSYYDKLYLNKIADKNIVLPSFDDRVDLRDLPTLTIDYIKYEKGNKMLYDDAFSYEELEDGTIYMYMHVPDMDEYIERDSDLDLYMEEMGLSRYAKCDKRPMVPYEIANKMSLIKKEDRCALTYRFHLTHEGVLINMDIMKTIINVDDNLSKYKADLLINASDYKYRELLEHMHSLCKRLRIKRHEKVGKRSGAGLIMDEYNIWSNLLVASYCDENGILFPYKNLVVDDNAVQHQFDVMNFLEENSVDKNARLILSSIVETKPRTYYSLDAVGNHNFNNMIYGNVCNPLREYMSLESSRLLKDLLIEGEEGIWQDRITEDCIRATEQEARVKELYKTSQ